MIFFSINAAGSGGRTGSFQSHRQGACLQTKFWWGSRKLTSSRDVCTRSVRPSVFAWLFGYEIFTQKRSRLSSISLFSFSLSVFLFTIFSFNFFFPPPSCLYKRVTLKDCEREREKKGTTTWHTESTTRRKGGPQCLLPLQACWNSLPSSSFACRTRAEPRNQSSFFLLLLFLLGLPHFGWWLVSFHHPFKITVD